MTASSAPALAALPDNSPALQNPAIAHCCEVWESTLRRALKDGKNLVIARVAAHKAYQKSLPPLNGEENIRNFVACVAHGMLMGAMLSPDGARLLYAAQVASGVGRNLAAQPRTGGECGASAAPVRETPLPPM